MPAQSTGLSDRESIASAFAIAVESIVVLLAFSADVPFAWTIALHLAASLIIGLILFSGRDRRDDTTVACLMMLVIFVAGPAGAVASLAALAFVDHAGAGPEVLDAWYSRLAKASHADAATELTDRVNAGRVLRAGASAPVHFEDVIANGTLDQRQAALGLMARRFHTDFAPALQAALRSDDPVVRVQAAAVVARVRADLKLRIKSLLSMRERRTPPLRVALAAELVRLACCPLVDRTDAEKCQRAASEAMQILLVTKGQARRASFGATRETAPVIERSLIASGRYGDFRVSRRIHAVVVGRQYRVRQRRITV